MRPNSLRFRCVLALAGSMLVGSAIPLRPQATAMGQSAGKISARMPVGFVVRIAQTVDAAKDLSVFWGDTIRTERGGRVRVRLDDSSILNIGSESAMNITSHEAAAQRTRLELLSGRMRAHAVRLAKDPSDLQVRTRVAVAGVVGTEFYVETTASQTIVVALEGGRVRVQSLDPRFPDEVFLAPGETVSIAAGQRPGAKRQATVDELTRAITDTAADVVDGLANRVVLKGKGALRLTTGSAVEAVLKKSLDAKTAKVGDMVEAQITSSVKSSGVVAIPRNAKLLGKVTAIQARTKSQKESKLGMQFDRAVLKDGTEIPLRLEIQSFAGAQPLTAGSFADEDMQATPSISSTRSRGAGVIGGAGTTVAGGATSTVNQTVRDTTQVASDAAITASRPAPVPSATSTATRSTVGGTSLDASGQSITRITSDSGLPGIVLVNEVSAASSDSLLTSQKRNVRLESGTRLTLRIHNAAP